MKAYVAMTEVDHEGAQVWGVFDNLEDAKACALRFFLKWDDEAYVVRWEGDKSRLVFHRFRDKRRKMTWLQSGVRREILVEADD